MKRFTYLSFCLLWLVPLVGLQASENFFWGDIQLDGSFCIKEDSYRVHINGMHPGREDNEMELNGILEDTRSIAAYRIRWHHAPSIHFERDMDEYDLEQNTYDPKGIFSFTGRGITLATHFLASIDLARLRVGLGAGVRCSFFNKMVGKWVSQTIPSHQQGLKNQLPGYIPAASYYFTWTPLVRCGLKLREATNYTLLLDGTWAPINYSFSEFGKSYCWTYNRSFDLGATWETHFTDYTHWSLRLGYSFCFHNEIVEAEEPSSADHLIAVGHYIGGVVAQVGIGISIPLFNKCPMDGCYTRLDHTHGGKYYKGKRAL